MLFVNVREPPVGGVLDLPCRRAAAVNKTGRFAFLFFRDGLGDFRRRHLERDGIAIYMKLHLMLPGGEAQRAKIGFFAECSHGFSLPVFLSSVNAVQESSPAHSTLLPHRQHLLKDPRRGLGHAAAVVFALDPGTTFFSDGGGPGRIVEQFAEPQRKVGGIFRFAEETSSARENHLGESSARRDDRRQSAGHRLEQVKALRLDEAGRHGEDVDVLEESHF